MSCSKLNFDIQLNILSYLNRDQLERFSIVSRCWKNIIEQNLRSKPYRVFERLEIRGGLYCLVNNGVKWHPNRKDYSAQQFLTNNKCWIDRRWCIKSRRMVNRLRILAGQPRNNSHGYYSFAEMLPYLAPSVRIKNIRIYVAGDFTYNQHIGDMESITYLWRDHDIEIMHHDGNGIVAAEDFQPILNSPTILQCRSLKMMDAHFSFKDFAILYSMKLILGRFGEDETDVDLWFQYMEQPVVKPFVVISCFRQTNTITFLDRLSEAFSSAVSPNAFTIVLILEYEGTLTEFRKTNKISGEILELKKAQYLEEQDYYTLDRYSV